MDNTTTAQEPHPQSIQEIENLYQSAGDLLRDIASSARNPTLPEVNEVIEKFSKAVDLFRTSGYECNVFEVHPWMWFATLADRLDYRATLSGNVEDLSQAVAHTQTALAIIPRAAETIEARYELIITLVPRLNTLWSLTGRKNVDILRTIADALRTLYALQRVPARFAVPTLRAIHLTWYFQCLVLLYQREHTASLLDEATPLYRQLLQLQPNTTLQFTGIEADLAIGLTTSHEETAERRYLDDGIDIARRAVQSFRRFLPASKGKLVLMLKMILSPALCTRYELSKQAADIDEAIACQKELLELAGNAQDLRLECLHDLSYFLKLKYDSSGALEDLDETIEQTLAALKVLPLGYAYTRTLTRLGQCYSIRYTRRNLLPDYLESGAIHQRALELRPVGHPERWQSLLYLSEHILESLSRYRRLESVDSAIEHLREAVTCCGDEDKIHSSVLPLLAQAFLRRYACTKDAVDLEECVRIYDDTIGKMGLGGDTVRAGDRQIQGSAGSSMAPRMLDTMWKGDVGDGCWILCNAGDSHKLRFKNRGEEHDLQQAIHYFKAAFKLIPTQHQLYSHALGGLAAAYAEQTPPSIDPFPLFTEATHNPYSPAGCRVHVAKSWAEHAHRLAHPSACTAYSQFFALFDRCLTTRTSIEMQYDLIQGTQAARVGSDAAAAAIGAGDLELAVELLERGRALLWGRMARFRDPLDRLRAVDAQLAEEFGEASHALQSFMVSPARINLIEKVEKGRPAPLAVLQEEAQRLRSASDAWDSVLDKIRHIDGFEHFLEAVPFVELQRAAADGPVIVVNISDHRSDAVIVVQASRPPALVTLPDANRESISQLVKTFLASIECIYDESDVANFTQPKTEAHEVQEGSSTPRAWTTHFRPPPDRRAEKQAARRKVKGALGPLWDLVVSPIAAKLKELDVQPQSRVWWYPTGPLWRLPLHAAGRYGAGETNFHDLYVSSYMSTFSRALASVAKHQEPTIYGVTATAATLPRLLAIGIPSDPTDSANYLQYVEEEISELLIESSNDRRSSLSGLRLLMGEDATAAAVQEQLQDSPWVHFVCHGFQVHDPSPFESYFQLHNGERMTLEDLMRADLPRAELAFLSACNTATGDKTYDEVIHLAAAMQFCGFHAVVGTMWPMTDKDGPVVAKQFYAHMFNYKPTINANTDHINAHANDISFKCSAQALHDAVMHLRTKKVPVERWINFVHYGL